MLSFLFALCILNSPEASNNATAQPISPDEKSRYPECVYIDTTGESLFNVTLEKDKSYCFTISGSIFINGQPVQMTGHLNGKELFTGKGVAATMGNHDATKRYIVIVKTSVKQNVQVFGSLNLRVGTQAYITTKKRSVEIIHSRCC